MKKNKLLKQAISMMLILATSASAVYAADLSAITPVAGSYGYFVDNYKTNQSKNLTPETNAVIGVLSSSFGTIWKPGSSWNNGSLLNRAGEALHQQNMLTSVTMTHNRTSDQELAAYLTDRRNQSYSSMDGLGIYKEAFQSLAKAETSLPASIPADAETKKYSDKGGATGNWADENSSLGNIVKLVDTVRGPYSSGNPAKNYFQYMRPYRWNSQVQLMSSLIPCKGDPISDGGFPSGHTNAGYLASLALAYAVPERFQELLTNASEIGNYRIIAGMHSSFDVIGGRIMATALAAAILNDPENAELKEAARKEATNVLLQSRPSSDLYTNKALNKQNYEERLTYHLPQTGETGRPMVVPKGAEVLLETRFPYLDADQRRWVLYSTGLPSGYALLDDTEGWGRLNLYAAADGYARFNQDVSVNMDASEGGFSAYDTWANDISGEGSLSKNGSGTLCLSGKNSFTGGVYLNDGVLNLQSSKALGNGLVMNNASLKEDVSGPIYVNGVFTQSSNAQLNLDINASTDALIINNNAKINGTLNLDFTDYPNPETGTIILKANSIDGSFSSIHCVGLNSEKKVVVSDNEISIQNR